MTPTRIYEERVQRGYPPIVDKRLVRNSKLSALLYSGMALDAVLRPKDAETFKDLLVDAYQSQSQVPASILLALFYAPFWLECINTVGHLEEHLACRSRLIII